MSRPDLLPVEDVIVTPERARDSISPDGTRIDPHMFTRVDRFLAEHLGGLPASVPAVASPR